MPQGSSSTQKSALSKTVKVGVLFGGTSSERKISSRSGKAVLDALAAAQLNVIALDPARKQTFQKKLKTIDVAFIALHGKGGEDGVLQKKLEGLGIPYVGSDPEGCKRSFDKVLTKRILIRAGLPTPVYRYVTRSNWKMKTKNLAFPWFVKPSDEGSSIGVFSVEDSLDAADKLTVAFRTHPKLLIESKITGREFTVGILGSKALPVIELRPKRSFYDFKAKYTKGLTKYLLPAPISEKLEKKLQNLALKTHKALGLRDLSRVDMMTDEQMNPYILEANTIPGFTGLSLLPKAAKEAGHAFEEVCVMLTQMAWKRR